MYRVMFYGWSQKFYLNITSISIFIMEAFAFVCMCIIFLLSCFTLNPWNDSLQSYKCFSKGSLLLAPSLSLIILHVCAITLSNHQSSCLLMNEATQLLFEWYLSFWAFGSRHGNCYTNLFIWQALDCICDNWSQTFIWVQNFGCANFNLIFIHFLAWI